uniref:Xyloglucan endotransglucosylase/hydrolase n=1 Tax=Elaeis guineensis var. tenera TaxID=51953 RepID=A0A8N4F626_ELAGV|nr:LOW QUALITY PROTEIN: probable xyloglucan endotransglucosylase/hydrolase protein 26 [Elaeis guineensis]
MNDASNGVAACTYSTQQIFPDGSFVAIGGRRQYSYEYVLPKGQSKPTNYKLSIPFLKETTEEREYSNRQNSTIWDNGDNLALLLDKVSCSAIQTNKEFLFGSIEMQIKLVPGNSAGTVIAYYMPSTGSKHDEIDFEFLRNLSGQPYIIHTNIFTQGVGNREQQFYPWFNPTSDFHNYTIYWNPSQIVWFADGLPIRDFRNYERFGIPLASKQSMRGYSSLWNADDWATRGGLIKIDWKNAPFIARYHQLSLRTCTWTGPARQHQPTCSNYPHANWWASPLYGKLNDVQKVQLNWVRENFMIYDYCKDTKRFNGQFQPECKR